MILFLLVTTYNNTNYVILPAILDFTIFWKVKKINTKFSQIAYEVHEIPHFDAEKKKKYNELCQQSWYLVKAILNFMVTMAVKSNGHAIDASKSPQRMDQQSLNVSAPLEQISFSKLLKKS